MQIIHDQPLPRRVRAMVAAWVGLLIAIVFALAQSAQ